MPRFTGQQYARNALQGTVVAFLMAGTAASQEDRLELAEQRFSESYAGDVKVSGDLLVALAYEAHGGQLDLDNVRLDFRGGADERVCVRLTTSDGRYWALNTYRAQAQYARPPTIPIPTEYEEQLRSYNPDDFLVFAFRGDCDSGSAQSLVAARVNEADQPAHLLAYVNINRGRASARLEQNGRTVAENDCTSPSAQVAYSRVCRLPIRALARDAPAKLVLELRSLTGAGLEQAHEVVLW